MLEFVDDVSGEIIYRSTIRSAIEPDTANLQVDLIKPRPEENLETTEDNGLLDELMSLAYFKTPFSHLNYTDLAALIPSSTKSKTWQDIKRGENHHEDTQQCYFQSEQPKSRDRQHRYPTRSKSREANVAKTDDNGEPTPFVYLRDDREKTTSVWKQYEFILRNKLEGAKT